MNRLLPRASCRTLMLAPGFSILGGKAGVKASSLPWLGGGRAATLPYILLGLQLLDERTPIRIDGDGNWDRIGTGVRSVHQGRSTRWVHRKSTTYETTETVHT